MTATFILPRRRAAVVVALCVILAGVPAARALTPAQQAKLQSYAAACVRYFTSPESNNLATGMPHTFYGTGKPGWWRTCDPDTGAVTFDNWELNRGYGSYFNINEVTLRLVVLAAAEKSGWLTHISPGNRYAQSWGQIKTGLQTLRGLQTSGQVIKFDQGTFHRIYENTIQRLPDLTNVDRTAAETVRRGVDEQASDDAGLAYMNLLVVEGLAAGIAEPDRSVIVTLCQEIRGAMNLRRFYRKQWSEATYFPTPRDLIVMNYVNGLPSLTGRVDLPDSVLIWDRRGAEGVPIATAMLLSGGVTVQEFEKIAADSMINTQVNWHTGAGTLSINQASFHSAMFMHGLRAMHGMPVTSSEVTGASFYADSTLPVFRAHKAFAETNGFIALGTQPMSQLLKGYPLSNAWAGPGEFQGGNHFLVRYPGNDGDVMPSGSSITGANARARSTAPHAFFIPLARASELSAAEVDWIFSALQAYESFFHPEDNTGMGWEAVIPWTPTDTSTQVSWQGTAPDSTVRRNYSDWGRPYEALNSAYIILCIFDALNPAQPLASYNVAAEKIRHVAAYLDSGTPLPQEPLETDPRMRAEFTSMVRTGTDVQITWATYPGMTYTLQYSETLVGGAWADLATVTGPAYPATTAMFTDTAHAGGQGFYRVRWEVSP